MDGDAGSPAAPVGESIQVARSAPIPPAAFGEGQSGTFGDSGCPGSPPGPGDFAPVDGALDRDMS
eukprot:CAMPEP_0175827512 /NCGR_PEP_ID=MMETSP0107_2-20121207/12323_1 /TAXON_ID=195067 ORGANISM="Goniomonas pacifica, Strain CCMP1869" /NCGR_SAMPLE_ID=MMETSP0107_2 /ASSEMBLY_ACC=CAM_ASM_000203 /LENGTH=64 /DNA_ID=CAMNT_0017140193 /DNA_START=636 /DNA_END=826 /DNA_ORIENTATION=-